MLSEDFVQSVGEWADKNFDAHDPWLGMVEEVGELAHCLLKRLQKIRGFEDNGFFLGELADAIGDFTIYAAHYAYTRELSMYLGRESGEATIEIAEILHHLSLLYSSGVGVRQREFSHVVRIMKWMALSDEIDFERNALVTWNRVSKRDWRAAPTSGVPCAEVLPPAEQPTNWHSC